MSEHMLPKPTTAAKAQALIASLRAEFGLENDLPDPDLSRALDDYLDTEQWIPEVFREFLQRNHGGVRDLLEAEKKVETDYTQQKIDIARQWLTAHNITDHAVERIIERNWRAEVAVLESVSGDLVPVVVEQSTTFRSILEAEEWARESARKVARTTSKTIAAYLVHPASEDNDRDLRIPIVLTD